MKIRIFLLLTGFVGLLLTGGHHSARADIAPPPPAAGSDLGPETNQTMVRMVSESVLLDITPLEDISIAYVTARFQMQNMGAATELMTVRFPMNSAEWTLESEFVSGAETCEYSPAPPIKEFSVRVDGVSINPTVTSQPFLDPQQSGPENGDVYVTLPCWAHFVVTFPPGENVEIEIRYVQAEYPYNLGGRVEFAYVIGTGSGWYSTIGEADITARLPYPANTINVYSCLPTNCEIAGPDIRYHFEDFEPDGNLYFRIVKPTIWSRVLVEQQNIEANAEDGEAWGRLGKAYKDALDTQKGFLSPIEPGDLQLFEFSRGAYQKAVELLPEDIDWQFGYADLLCRRGGRVDEDYKALEACLNQLQFLFNMDPSDTRSYGLLESLEFYWYGANRSLVDLTGPEPIFLILTPQSSPTSTIQVNTPTATPFPTHASEPPTATAAPLPSATPVSESPEPGQPSQLSDETGFNPLIPAGVVVLVLVLGGVLLVRRKTSPDNR